MENDKWGFGSADRSKSWGTAIIGDAKTGKRVPLLWGEHKHSYNDNRIYADLGGKEPEAFDGHRILIDVRITMSNYLKESHLSGDEVRKGGSCTIIADGVDIYEFFARDTLYALDRAKELIRKLSDHSSGWLVASERERLIGRKVYYRDQPAIIKRLIEDQGCVIVEPDGIERFSQPAWLHEDGVDPDDEVFVKDDVLSESIWWFRKDQP